jgi:serine phosphatase RsbU (regulator of sigma subunit)
MNSISRAFGTNKTRSARIYRWVTVWLFTSAVISLLLLANSIRDYRFVSSYIATQQVRHQMSQHAVALEHQLRQNPLTRGSSVKSLMEAGDNPVWIELRTPEGTVLEHAGGAAQRSFSREEERSHLPNHEPLFKIAATSAGDAVVELFLIYAPAASAPANSPPSPTVAQPRPPGLLVLEIAIPLSAVDRSIFWPIRRNLFINCSGALALLVTVIISGLGFRSFAHGKELEEQLEIARQVQSELLPAFTEKYAGVQLATVYTPAEQVGGDFYDVFRVKDDGIALVMGDVSGKGVPAALLMGVIHGAVRSSLWAESAAQHELESQQLNRLLCERASGERYASMFWCYYDPFTHSLSYVNAGHCPPFLTRKSGGEVEISRLDAGGPVLGVLPEALYQQTKLGVSPDHVLVMYSDGLVEATNSSGEEYGEGRLHELLATVGEKSVGDIRGAILASLAAFSSTAELRDDLTFVVVRFRSTDG